MKPTLLFSKMKFKMADISPPVINTLQIVHVDLLDHVSTSAGNEVDE